MRITIEDLNYAAEVINQLTGNHAMQYTIGPDGMKANIGNYHISGAYGGYALHQMVNEGGGITEIFSGYRPKRELYNLMQAYIKGLQAKGENYE